MPIFIFLSNGDSRIGQTCCIGLDARNLSGGDFAIHLFPNEPTAF